MHFESAIKLVASLNKNKDEKVILEELAYEVQLSYETVRDWYKGYRIPKIERMKKVMQFLNRKGPIPHEMANDLIKASGYGDLRAIFAKHYLQPRNLEDHHSKIRSNLPSRIPLFRSRTSEMAKLVYWLCHPDSRAVTIVLYGLGGIGKTSLAIEIGYACLQPESSDVIAFDAVVFSSDRNHSAEHSLTLEKVLDEIGRELKDEAVSRSSMPDKKKLVQALLSGWRVLLIVDNFETIRDSELSRFLLEEVPSPSKVLITTRECGDELTQGTWRMELQGLPDEEALELIHSWANENFIQTILLAPQKELEPLVRATSGNPYAIQVTLGLISVEHQPLSVILRDLWEGRGNIFEYIFSRVWTKLGKEEKQILMSMPYFVAPALRSVIGFTASVEGYYLDQGLGRLARHSLIMNDGYPDENNRRYSVHPLVRAFARACLQNQMEFSLASRKRWQEWYVHFLEKHGSNDWSGLMQLENEFENITAVIDSLSRESSQIVSKCIYHFWHFLYIRGYWEQCITYLSQGIEYESISSGSLSEMGTYFYLQYNWVKSHQGDATEVINILYGMYISPEYFLSDLNLADLLSYLGEAYLLQRDYESAEKYLQESLSITKRTGNLEDEVSAAYYLGKIHIMKGNYWDAFEDFSRLNTKALKIPWKRGAGYCSCRVAETLIYLDQFEQATKYLNETEELAKMWKDPQLFANTLFIRARLRQAQGLLVEAKMLAIQAHNLYKQLGALFDARDVKEFLDNL